MICSSCFKEMTHTGMENCIHCGGSLKQHPASQLEIDITRVDKMTGHEFENFLESLFRTQGYQVKNIQGSGDHGVDLVVVKGGVRTGVQAKRFKPTSKIGNEVLIKLKGGGYFHECQKLLVVTTSYYTAKAKEYAEGVGIELWDRTTLKNYLLQYNKHLGE
jgi:HJR/Mrr/RecB family endonuclease